MVRQDPYRIKLIFFIVKIILYLSFSKCHSNEILGCGGFVKSHVNLDFSKIEIGLYTKEGILKEKTECAPTNGYYFLPMYEHGEYVVKVHPPAGWSFEPSEVELFVNGETDRCSTGQDINFAFNGFGITGRVITAGQASGPSGITVQLVDNLGGIRETQTTNGGDFHFTPVIPGKYTVKASHPKWKLDPGEAMVQVTEGNTALPVGVLAVKGYEVTGSITSFSSPIQGIYVLLYSKEEKQKLRVEGCKTALLQGVPDSPICYTISDENGEFQFGLVPAGEYKLLALSKPPGQAVISYNIKPESVPFGVKHNNIYVKNAFEVTGFNIIGSVLNALGGDGVLGVRVLSDGTPVGTTDATGKFALSSLRPGVYTLSFQHEQCEVEELQVAVGTGGPQSVVRAVVARWRVCGDVSPPERRRVVLATSDSIPVYVTPKADGTWCTFLSPGTYTAKVEVSEEELRDGLQWYPASRTVTVSRGGASNVGFSQVRALVRGRVRAASGGTTGSLRVRLRALAPDGGYVARGGDLTVSPDDNGEYEFRDVVPGSVEVSVEGARLCWLEARHNVAVASELALVPTFEQSGYLLHLSTDYDIEVEYKSTTSEGVLKVPAGDSQQCLPTLEVYTLRPRGCHRFQPSLATVDLAAEQLPSVQFWAVAHAAVVRVTSPDTADDLVLRITTSADGTERVGPLTPVPDSAHGYVFEHTLYLADGEVASVSALSGILLVTPRGAQRVSARGVCGSPALVLRAARGLTLAGHLLPPVEGALVTLRADDVHLSQVTQADGAYRFGPLEPGKEYMITAEKESYVFSERDADGNIAAHKLAEILVQLIDESNGSPLEGALVSVSGGEYRRTAATGPDGLLRFTSLAPAHYYVRPHLKEYRLRPPHATLHVPHQPHQPAEYALRFSGVRVAWSVSGRALSLGGVGVPGVRVRALPAPGASAQCVPQDATAANDATFRVRGLVPNCSYKIELKETSAPELDGLRLAKAPPVIEMNERDVEDVRLIVVQRRQLTDGSVLVRTPLPEHYRTLRLTLAAEHAPHTPLLTARPEPAAAAVAAGYMVTLPRLPPDNATYLLRLDSTLSKATHDYEELLVYFTSDGRYKSFNFDFLPKVRASEQELRATSALLVPLLVALALAAGQRERVATAARSLAAATVTATAAATTAATTATTAATTGRRAARPRRAQ